jgi:hypothetical protein
LQRFFLSFLLFTLFLVSFSIGIGYIGSSIFCICIFIFIYLKKDSIVLILENKTKLLISSTISFATAFLLLLKILFIKKEIGILKTSLHTINSFIEIEKINEVISNLHNIKSILIPFVFISLCYLFIFIICIIKISRNKDVKSNI